MRVILRSFLFEFDFQGILYIPVQTVKTVDHSCSSIFVTVVHLCALVDVGQHLPFFVRVLDGVFFFCFCFFVNRGRSGGSAAISIGFPNFFVGFKIRNSLSGSEPSCAIIRFT